MEVQWRCEAGGLSASGDGSGGGGWEALLMILRAPWSLSATVTPNQVFGK